MANHSSLGFRAGEWRLLDSEKEDLEAFGFRAGGLEIWIQSWLTRRIERAIERDFLRKNKRFPIETRGLRDVKAFWD